MSKKKELSIDPIVQAVVDESIAKRSIWISIDLVRKIKIHGNKNISSKSNALVEIIDLLTEALEKLKKYSEEDF